MRKWIEKVYRPAGFILLGALIGSGLTLAIQGKLSTPDIALWVLWLLGFGILVANGRRNRTLFRLAISLGWAGSAVGLWLRGKLPDAIGFTILALIYAGLAWSEHADRKKARAVGGLASERMDR